MTPVLQLTLGEPIHVETMRLPVEGPQWMLDLVFEEIRFVLSVRGRRLLVEEQSFEGNVEKCLCFDLDTAETLVVRGVI